MAGLRPVTLEYRSCHEQMGPVGQLGRPSASDPGGVDRCVPALCCPRCTCVCGVLAHLVPVHRCARCVQFVSAVGGCVPPPPPPLILFFFCSVFVFFLFSFCLKWKRGRVHGAGTGMSNWCTGTVVLRSPVCVVGALSPAAPQGCGSLVLMYMCTGQGGFG